MYEYSASVVHRVLDGDTIEVTLSLGFDTYLGPKTLRFNGLNAPEIHDSDPAIQKRAQAAMDFVKTRLLPEDTTKTPKVKLQTYKPDSTDKYGRFLADVFYLPPPPPKKKLRKGETAQPAPDWISLNKELLDAKLVKSYDGQGVKPV